MSRVHYGSHGSRAVTTRMSRRRALTIAGAVGVGVTTAGVVGVSLAGETPEASAAQSAPLVVSLRDAKKGTFDVFSGGSKFALTDKKLAAQLLKIAKRS
jgi:hypothetical protein